MCDLSAQVGNLDMRQFTTCENRNIRKIGHKHQCNERHDKHKQIHNNMHI